MQKTIEREPRFEQWLKDAPRKHDLAKGISLRRFACELLITLALAAVAYLSLSAYWIKFSRAEVFFAECAREMLTNNNFITPLYHNQPFFDKPIFVYWLIIAMFKGIGISHFAARIPMIFASLVTILTTALAGAYLFGRRTGLLAACMLSTGFMYLSFSCLCMSDMFLVMFDAFSLFAVYAGIISKRKRTLYWWLAALSMGFAFLTKGPVGIVLPALASLIYLALVQRLTFIKAKHIIWGLITVILVASPWFYAAYLANGSQSMVHFFIQENLQRFAGSTYDVHRPFWYTIVSFFLGFAPWSLLTVPALFWFGKNLIEFGKRLKREIKVSADLHYENVKNRSIMPLSLRVFRALNQELSAELFLWVWVFVSVGFFCFSRGKCDYYTLPAFTGAALLCARYVGNCHSKYLTAINGLAFAVLASTIIFSIVILPQINKLVPVSKYVTMIKTGPSNMRVGIEDTAASWIDEILFQSGKDAQRLSNAGQMAEFMSKGGPRLLIVPENKYNLLPAAQREKYHIISSDTVATHPLTPGYLFEKAGNIADAVPLVVATNFDDSK